ncbi:hypothetical protein H2199_007007 [Coniosporium tulheliwenetii]|uniref:Uncharacterized protein n=1 Tax=Coniosporium tulheliwenetii TaxID=3383036 RepID=A0ACC2YSS6_9PEZI|nr:hypothetical protein H2199_007007 [Cladosporium sp. JES 115]
MPRAARRRAQPPAQHFVEPQSDTEEVSNDEVTDGHLMENVEIGEEERLPSEIDGIHDLSVPPPPPPYTKEISSLASWTVSSSKPGCGVASLRSPSTALFWQSDGPQPHYLNIHFFKLVEIVGLRLFLDFEQDESYTPTRIAFLAGSGGVGAAIDISDSDNEDADDIMVDEEERQQRREGRRMPVLRAFLLQVKIMENHQNGKDTHLRALQIYARDKSMMEGKNTIKKATNGISKMQIDEVKTGGKKKRVVLPDWGAVPELR